MSKRPSGKLRIVPEQPKKAIRKLEKNGFVLKNTVGSHFYYYKEKDKEDKLVCIFVHPKELGKPAIKNIIRKSGKTNKEWVTL